MRAGGIDKVIVIQRRTVGKDADHGRVDIWSTWKSVWAGVKPLSGNERSATSHGGQVAEARTEFTIWYLPGIDETMRIAYGGKVYNIRHIKDVNEAHKSMILTCDTGVNDG